MADAGDPSTPLASRLRQGVAAHRSAELDLASTCFEQACDEDPANLDALLLLGSVRIAQDRKDAGAVLIQRSLQLRPDFPPALQALARLWREQGRVNEAFLLLRRARQLQPDNHAVQADLGLALYEAGRPEEAIACFQTVLAATPDDLVQQVNLGRARRAAGDFPGAETAYRAALALAPNEPQVHNNLGNVQLAQGDPGAAIASYRRAIALRGDYGDAHYNLGMALLAAGQMQAGWRECAWRLRTPAMRAAFDPAIPFWSGEPIPGKTLLLRAEQGQGDTIQFCRYTALAAERSGARIVLDVQGSLTGLFPGWSVIAQGDTLPPVDVQYPLMSLPSLFDTIPADVPYLTADPAKVAVWRLRLDALPGLKVGLVWAGDPRLGNTALLDRRRSMRLAQFAPLAAVTDAVFVSLQKGHPAAEASTPPTGMALLDWTAELRDFADTASLIAALDLVIGVDTAVIHLAGALGRPVWLLNRKDSEWRWRLEGAHSPWYPTMRIFRQTVFASWDEPVRAVSAALAGFPRPVREDAPAALGALLRDGLADQTAGRAETAMQRYADVLRVDPEQPDALYLSGMFHLAGGRMQQGIALVQHALQRRPAFPAALFNLGMAFHALDREADAVEQFRQALALDPDMAEAHAALGGSLHKLARMEDARAAFLRALELRPDDAMAQLNCGVVLQAMSEIEAAIACYRHCLALQPDNLDGHNNLGTALAALHEMDAAIASYHRALALDPNHAQTHTNLGIALLQAGRYAKGWREWAWRLDTPQGKPEVRGFAQPEWTGAPIPGQILLLHAEQGLGDTLMLCRYVPLALQRSGAVVILEVQPELVRLLHAQTQGVQVLPRGAALPRFDWHCSLASLPGVFETTLDTVPADIPYLRAIRTAAMRWREKLSEVRGIRVGIVWAGNAGLGTKTHNPVDQQRSLPLATLAPLARVPGVALISLQKGPASGQPRPDGMILHDWTDELADFADTAALVMCLHLVISVDTATAHLAGALGRPVWLLNRFHPDWRWLLGREDSPWYPTLRQFRQTARDDWTPVIAAVTDALTRMAAGPPENEPFEHGNTRFRQGDYAAAAAAFRQTIAINPRHAGARGNLSVALLARMRPAEAEQQARKALDTAPDSQPLRLRLGIALHAQGRFAEAVPYLQQAATLRPDDADAQSALGNALAASGATAAGIAAHRRAIALRPDSDLLHANLGYVLLQAGQWAEGWREHEHRADRPKLTRRWNGERLATGVLLLRAEQGYGDIIQFCRYAPLAAERSGVRTLLTAPLGLRDLLRSLPGVTIVPPDTALREGCDFPLLSLPLLFGSDEATIPARVPYLRADPGLWGDRVRALPGLRVGVAWAGNPGLGRASLYATDQRRSLQAGGLAALGGAPGVSFVSLQVGPAPPPGLAMQDWTAELGDFAATAGLMGALDLVIAVDTAAVHLAGALGRPVWLLNRFDADWRWLTERDGSSWYPTLRQFRQTQPGDWASVVARVGAALTVVAQARSSPPIDRASNRYQNPTRQ